MITKQSNQLIEKLTHNYKRDLDVAHITKINKITS